MKRSRPPPRQILLAWALLASVAAAAWYTAGQAITERMTRGQARVESLAARVDAMERAAARDPALRPELAAARIEGLRGFLERATVAADTLEVAGSLLQRRLGAIIEKHGGEPGNTRVSTDPHADSMTVSTHFEADLPAVAAVLDEITGAVEPLLLVDLVSVRRRDPYLDAAGTDPSAQPDLVVQLDVTAFWRGRPGDG